MLSTVGIRVLWCSWCQFRWRYRCGVLAHAWGCTATTARLVFEGVPSPRVVADGYGPAACTVGWCTAAVAPPALSH
jgi:hypothetical protein